MDVDFENGFTVGNCFGLIVDGLGLVFDVDGLELGFGVNGRKVECASLLRTRE